MAATGMARVNGGNRRVLKFTGIYSGESWQQDHAYMILIKDAKSDMGHRLKEVWVKTQYQFKLLGAKRGERYEFDATWYKYKRADLRTRWGLSLEGNQKRTEA